MRETRTGRKTNGTLQTGAQGIAPNVFRLGTAVFDRNSLKSLMRIRYDVRHERLVIPKKAMPLLSQFAEVRSADVFRLIGDDNEYLLEEITDSLAAIKDDPIMRAQDPLTAERVLVVATVLFIQAVGDGFDWSKAKFGRLELTVLPAAKYRTEYMGKVFVGMVSGLTRLVGSVRDGGRAVTMFPKFITHPFHQYGRK